MRRREFVTLIGAAAAVWPRGAGAQQKSPTIGFLGASSQAAVAPWTGALVKQLRELGWIEGRNLAIEYRWAEGRPERAAAIAAELVQLRVDVIVTHSNSAVLAAKKATKSIPIVFGAAGDPVDAGLVASLTRPGGNVTGMSLQQTDTAAKRLEILREVVPGLRRLAIFANPDNRSAALERQQLQAAARTLGLEAILLEVRRGEDIAGAFDEAKSRADAVYFCNDPLLVSNRVRISTLASAARLPTMFNFRENVDAGGLVSYGANVPDLFRRAAYLVDKILRGAKPADLPVEQPTKFDLVINLATAKALGLKLPESLLLRADEVIE